MDYLESGLKAVKHIKTADHVLTVSYPLVNDPKLLKHVMKNVYKSIYCSMLMLMQHERIYKRVPPFTSNFELLLSYQEEIFERYKLNKEYIKFIKEINDIMHKQKQSEVEFVRQDKFVFASKHYDLEILTEQEIKEYLTKAKFFIKEVMRVLNG